VNLKEQPMPSPAFIVSAVVVIIVIIVVVKSIHIIPQARARIIERLGRYRRTADAGLTMVIPFIDRMGPIIDLREQVQPFPPQPVITEDNLVVNIDTVVYYQVTDPRAATYEIEDYIRAVEQLTTTTLRNVVGGLNLEEALTSRDRINGQLRGVLDEATGKWGIRVSRVELKAIEPPISIQDSMEKQMRAERDRRAAILTAEGTKQSQILTAEGERQAAILSAEGSAKAAVLKARGEAEAIETVFDAVHTADADPKLLAYQYLQQLPKIAEGASNKLWLIPTNITDALKGLGGAFGDGTLPTAGGPDVPAPPAQPRPPRERRHSILDDESVLGGVSDAAREAAEAAAAASKEVGGDVGVPPVPEQDAEPSSAPSAPPVPPSDPEPGQQPPAPGGPWTP
jgi:regulator of protease activity HflC (stomatin/prohibitin superfamily)